MEHDRAVEHTERSECFRRGPLAPATQASWLCVDRVERVERSPMDSTLFLPGKQGKRVLLGAVYLQIIVLANTGYGYGSCTADVL